MDFNWRFQLGDQTGADQKSYDDNSWRTLDLPHDWSIEGEYSKDEPTGGSGGYLPTGIGWYRKHFKVSKSDLKKNIRIEFDGVYMNSDVWLNGYHLGNYPYGYSSFFYELNDHLVEGENVIAVRVDNSKQPNTRWYSGSGIYRNVWLVISDQLHIKHWGIYVTTPEVSAEKAEISVKTKIENGNKSSKDGMLKTVLLDDKGNEVTISSNSF